MKDLFDGVAGVFDYARSDTALSLCQSRDGNGAARVHHGSISSPFSYFYDGQL